MKIELVETMHTYRIKLPKLSENQCFTLSDILKHSPVRDETRVGDGDNCLVIQTTVSIDRALEVVTNAVKIAQSKIWKYVPAVPMSEIPVGSKFIVAGDNRVYTKEGIGQRFALQDCTFHKNTAKGGYNCFLMMNDYQLVHPIETDALFVNLKK